jgi:broad specificity phosphatase PhoE
MHRIYLARHGQSTWNVERRWTGHADPPLSERGRAQASEACDRLRELRFDAVVSSTLVRAVETASIIATALGVKQLEPAPQFDERFAGPISGMTSAELEAHLPGFMDQWRAGVPAEIPGGEPWQDFVARAQHGLALLRGEPGRILVVSHMGVQRAIEQAGGRPLRWYGNLEGFWVGATAPGSEEGSCSSSTI